ncbi:MAG TPA: hypothetical protein VN371_06490 [Chlorobaculum sp.]|nr:hypothetical protein [Chlorobaculum sp.]
MSKYNQSPDNIMNERLASGLLAGLSAALIIAEASLAALYGFQPGLVLFCMSIYAGAAGLLFSLRTLMDGRESGVESVSERRARAKQDRSMGSILEGYDVDQEFIGRGRGVGKPASTKASGASGLAGGGTLDDEELKSAVIAYAGMAGGAVRLRETLESMSDAAFRTVARNAGMAGVTRERALAVVTELAAGGEAEKERPVPTMSFSLDHETFDDYIRRGMSEGDSCPDDDDSVGFSIGLDAAGLSALPSEPPTDFSHDPKAIFSKLKRGGDRR